MGDASKKRGSGDASGNDAENAAPVNPRAQERAIREAIYRDARQKLADWANNSREEIRLLLPSLSGRASKQAQNDAVALLFKVANEMNGAMVDPDNTLYQPLRNAKQEKRMEEAHLVVLEAGALMADYSDGLQIYNSFRAKDAVNKVYLVLNVFTR